VKRLGIPLVVAGLMLLAGLPGAADPAVTLDRAQQSYTAGEYAEAEKAAQEAIAASDDPAILCGAADVLILCKLSAGDFEGAARVARDLKSPVADSAVQAHLDKWIADIEANKGSYDKAIAELEAALKAHPDDEAGADAAYQIGSMKSFWGKGAEALSAFQLVIDQFPSSDRALQARLAMGGIHEGSRKYKEAEDLYAQVVSRAPDSACAAQAVARIKALRLAQEDAAGARDRMNELVKAHPDTEASAMAEYCLGELLLYEGKLYEGEGALGVVAREHSDKIAGGMATVQAAAALMSEAYRLTRRWNWKGAIEEYTKVIEIAPKTAYARQALLQRARNYAWAGDNDKARQDYEAILSDDPDSLEVYPALFYLARQVEGQEKSQKAIAFLEPHATSGPQIKQAAALLLLEGLYRETRLEEKADAARERLRKEFPASREIEDLGSQVESAAGYHMWFKRGTEQEQAYAEAAVMAESALLLNLAAHSRSRLMLDVGWHRCRAGQHVLALDWYEHIRKDDAGWEEIVTVIARAGECKAHLGDYESAIALFEQAASQQPLPREKGRLLVRAAEFCREARLYDRGLRLLEKLRAEVDVQQFPDVAPRWQLTVGLLWEGKGDMARALSEFQRVLDLYPEAKNERPQALLRKGICLEALGDANGALACYRELLEAYPAHPARADAGSRLARLLSSK